MKSITKNRVVRALSPTWRSARVLIAVAMAGVLSAACDVHGISAPGTLKSISVSPNATLVAGTTQQMVAVGYDADGRVMNISPTWSVAASGGTIASSGVFTAGTVPGLFANTVVASVGTISGNASITVIPGPLATITVVPTPVTLAVLTGTQQFTAVGKDASGNIVAFSPTWSVVASGGAITQAGIFTAGGTAGTFTNTVKASNGTINGFATVIVTPGPLTSIVVTPNPATLPVGQSQQFTAVGKDAGGNVLSFTPVWTVVAGGGTINSTGLFVAGGTLGTFANTVKATSGSVSGTATVEVTLGALATITVTPNPVTLAISGTQQMIAVGKDAGGNIVAITPVWSVVNSGGVIDPSTGIFTAGLVAGTFNNTVVATSGTISGTATVNVTPILMTITVLPNPASVIVNGTQQFAAVGRDAGGNVFAISPVWSVVNGGGSIDANTGVFTAGAVVGPFANTVKATSGTISATATVNVTPPLRRIIVTPNPVSVVVSGTQQFSAVGYDALIGGNVFAISPVWSVAPGGSGTISATGLFTAGLVPGLYPDAVIATSGSVSATATVNVTPPLRRITVTPNPVSMVVSGTQQFSAVGYDELIGGNVFAMSPVWSVAPGGSGTISTTGLFTAGLFPGLYPDAVIATSASVSGKATVTVTALPPVLRRITITPDPASVLVNGTQQFAAVGYDAIVGGNIIAITPVWTVVAGGGDFITAADKTTGLFTAFAVPGAFPNTVKATSGGIFDLATVNVTAPPPPPAASPLASAANFGIISSAAINCADLLSPGHVSGLSSRANLGSVAGIYVGFPPVGPCTLDGIIPAAGVIATAMGHLTVAYLAAQAIPLASCTVLTGTDLGTYTGAAALAPGCYKFATSAQLTGNLTLTGSATDIWTFQIGSTLDTSVGSTVTLAGGAIPDNVYWAVGTAATLGTDSDFSGNIMSMAAITLNARATLHGRALAQTAAVSMIAGGARIIKP